jgi:hypothetical protein
VIKRIRFATRANVVEDFPTAWRAAVASSLTAPPDARPMRVTVCTVLADITPDPVHDGIGLEWFSDADHLARYEAWLQSPDAKPVHDLLNEVIVEASSPVVVAAEHVMRGEDWLEQRWRRGGDKLKHMAIARRAEGLTPAEFFDRWRNRAGKVGAVVIPDEARGLAYLQNHPVPRTDGEWPYDALNEVYFDDQAGLQARINWFAATLDQDSEADLVGAAWFVAAREEVL